MLGDRWFVDSTPTEAFPDYARGNSREVMSEPVSPLGWTFNWKSGIVLGCRDGFVGMGVFDKDEYSLANPESFGLFGGYLYNSLTQARLFGVRSGVGWQAIDNAYHDSSTLPPYEERDWHVSPRHSERLAKTMAWFMSTPDAAEIDKQKVEAKAIRDSRPDLPSLSTSQLLGRARMLQRHLRAMFAGHITASSGASVGPRALTALLADVDPTAVNKLLAGIGDVDSAQIANGIWRLSRRVRCSPALMAAFDAGPEGLHDVVRTLSGQDTVAFEDELDAFLHEHGSRGPNEWDMYSPSYETEPELLLSAIDRLRRRDDSADPRTGEERAAVEHEAQVARFTELFASNEEASSTFASAVQSTKVFMAARERSKSNTIRALHEVRMCFDELGRRQAAAGTLDHPRQIYMLVESELEGYFADSASFRSTLRQREVDYLALYDLEPPVVVEEQAPPLHEWRRRSEAEDVDLVTAGEILTGTPGAPGAFVGTAKILKRIDDPVQLAPSDVLIAPQTDPSWTPLFLAVGAVVTNVGAVNTHAVIVSRELGIPCVPSITGATERIPPGATVAVDGDHGTVTIRSLPT